MTTLPSPAPFWLTSAVLLAAGGISTQQPLRDPSSLSFVENRGQFDEAVRYRLGAPGMSIYLTSEAVVYSMRGQSAAGARQQAVVRARFVGSAEQVRFDGGRELPVRRNVYRGSDPARWQLGIRAFREIAYRDLYPGVDLVFSCDDGQVKTEWRLEPGADPGVIRWQYDGAERVTLAGATLEVETAFGIVREHPPYAYQEIDGLRREVTACYSVGADRELRFDLGEYDPGLPLIIDPVLVWSTFLGSDELDWARGIAVDSAGNVYVAGFTEEGTFPTTVGLMPYNSDGDAFVAKFDPSGSQLLASTCFGGGEADEAFPIAVDPTSGSVYVAGSTESQWLPGARSQALGPGGPAVGLSFRGAEDVFLAKFDAALNLLYSTYLGGSGDEEATGLAIASNGDVLVSGSTASSGFPVTPGAYQTTKNGAAWSDDVFITKISANGQTRLWSTFFGGSRDEEDTAAVGVDAVGNVYLAGATESADLPTRNAQLATNPGTFSGYAMKLDPTGSTLLYSTYLGGSGEDFPNALAVDSSGYAYVVGETESANFQPALRGSLQGPVDGFVIKLDPNGQPPIGSSSFTASYLGGDGDDGAWGVALSGGVPGARGLYVVGISTTSDRFASPVPYRVTVGPQGSSDAWLTKLTSAGDYRYFTFLGGRSEDLGICVAADGDKEAVIAGMTYSADFPTTPGSYDETYNYWGDAIIARFSDGTAASYGSGTFGSGPCIPSISAWGRTLPGGAFDVEVSDALGAGSGHLLLGLGSPPAVPLPLPFTCGGILIPLQVWASLPVQLGGSALDPCGGEASLPIPVPNNPALSGLSVCFQFLGLDPRACWGRGLFTLSNGLLVVIG